MILPPNEDIMILPPNKEHIVSQLLVGWKYDTSNWDNDGASPICTKSIQMAIDFVCLLEDDSTMPEPMFHSSGTVGLFWEDQGLYADLEFFDYGSIAYYIDINSNKFKGMSEFNTFIHSSVFGALLHHINPSTK